MRLWSAVKSVATCRPREYSMIIAVLLVAPVLASHQGQDAPDFDAFGKCLQVIPDCDADGVDEDRKSVV